jgi:hypothetical protein
MSNYPPKRACYQSMVRIAITATSGLKLRLSIWSPS